MAFDLIVAVVAVIAGMVASVAGFGIGSLLTPVLAFQVGTKLAVYLGTQGPSILQHWPHVIIGIVGVTAGTLIGARLLRRIPESIFRRIVGLLVLAIGIYMLVRPT